MEKGTTADQTEVISLGLKALDTPIFRASGVCKRPPISKPKPPLTSAKNHSVFAPWLGTLARGLRFWPARVVGLEMVERLLDARGRKAGLWVGRWVVTPDLRSDSRCRSRRCCLPVTSTRSATELRFSKLNSRPVDAPCLHFTRHLAAPGARLGVRMVRYYLWGSFSPGYTPVCPDDCACLALSSEE